MEMEAGQNIFLGDDTAIPDIRFHRIRNLNEVRQGDNPEDWGILCISFCFHIAIVASGFGGVKRCVGRDGMLGSTSKKGHGLRKEKNPGLARNYPVPVPDCYY